MSSHADVLLDILRPLFVSLGIPEVQIDSLLEYRETVDGFTAPTTTITSTNQSRRRLLTDGQVVEDGGQLRVNGGSWVINLTATPAPVKVRIVRIVISPNLVATDLLSALARIIYRDPSADYMFPMALEDAGLAPFWAYGKFVITTFYGSYVYQRRPVIGLTDFNHLDGWSEPSVPQPISLLIERHGKRFTDSLWDNHRETLNRLGDYDFALRHARGELKRSSLAPSSRLDPNDLPPSVRLVVLIHGERMFDALCRS